MRAYDHVRSGRRADEPVARPRFEPIQPQRAHEYVAEQIRRHIALRLIKPGESLPPERDLAATFGVGRPTIQAALRVLEAEGLVQTRRGRAGGTFVSELGQDGTRTDELILRVASRPKDTEDLLTFRRIVEPAVARVAAEQRAETDIAAMRRAQDGMAGASNEPDYMENDTAFHLALARASHNRYLAATIEEIRMGLNDAMTLLPETDAWHSRIAQEHEALIEAISAGDADQAERIMKVHVANSEQSLRAVLRAALRHGMDVIG